MGHILFENLNQNAFFVIDFQPKRFGLFEIINFKCITQSVIIVKELKERNMEETTFLILKK